MSPAFRPLALALVVLALGAAACGDDDEGDSDTPQTFEHEGFPFTFEYPGDWELIEDVELDTSLGSEADETVGVMLDEEDAIILQRFTLTRPVEEKDLDLARKEIDALLTQVDPGARSSPAQVDGLPALRSDDLPVPTLEGAESDLTFVFDGDQEFLVNCQSTEEPTEVEAACRRALETLTFE